MSNYGLEYVLAEYTKDILPSATRESSYQDAVMYLESHLMERSLMHFGVNYVGGSSFSSWKSFTSNDAEFWIRTGRSGCFIGHSSEERFENIYGRAFKKAYDFIHNNITPHVLTRDIWEAEQRRKQEQIDKENRIKDKIKRLLEDKPSDCYVAEIEEGLEYLKYDVISNNDAAELASMYKKRTGSYPKGVKEFLKNHIKEKEARLAQASDELTRSKRNRNWAIAKFVPFAAWFCFITPLILIATVINGVADGQAGLLVYAFFCYPVALITALLYKLDVNSRNEEIGYAYFILAPIYTAVKAISEMKKFINENKHITELKEKIAHIPVAIAKLKAEIEEQTRPQKPPQETSTQRSQVPPAKPFIPIQNRNWYYYDDDGQRQGLISSQKLSDLVVKGIITPQTRLETEDGHKGFAGQLNGLFPK